MKKILLSIFTCISLLATAQLTNGLLVHYELNGDANDATTNQLHGTVFGASTSEDRDGNASSALSFNGVNDYVELTDSDLAKPNFPLTIAFWMKVDQGEAVAVYHSDYVDNYYYGFWVNVTASDKVGISFGNSGAVGSSSRRTKTSDDAIQIGEWQHFVFTIRSANDMDIFRDCEEMSGQYSGSGSSTMAYSNNSGSLMRSLSYSQTPAVYLKGSLDDIMLWNRELTPTEIASFCELSSVEENKIGDLVVYPNPLNDVLKIKSNDVKIRRISVFNSEGKLVMEKSQGFDAINMETLDNGVYFVKIEDENSANTYKVIKD